jgi:hypothetical protein
MHFGLYLKNKGVITAEQLISALEAQLKTRVPIGQLALEEGIISPRDIFDVLRAQREGPTMRFGEIAIEMGLMTEDQLMRLLMIQSDRKRPVADILVMQGAITKEQASTELAEYRRANAKRRAGSAVRSKIVPAPRGAMKTRPMAAVPTTAV